MTNERAKRKKISKMVEGDILTIRAGEEVMKFNINDYNDDIKQRLMLHGLSQKLGDSAAGISSAEEAADCIKATNEILLKGEWYARKQSGEKVSKKDVREKYEELSDKEKAAVEPVLKKLGLIS